MQRVATLHGLMYLGLLPCQPPAAHPAIVSASNFAEQGPKEPFITTGRHDLATAGCQQGTALYAITCCRTNQGS